MYNQLIVLGLVLTIAVPVLIFFKVYGKQSPEKRKKSFKFALFANIATFFTVLAVSTVFIFTINAHAETTAITDQGLKFIAAALATGLATIGAGIATASAASSALGAISENDSMMGRALIFVALAEGIAIYGLLVTFMILNS